MTKILLYAVMMLSALWFFPVTCAHKTKHRSSVEDYDFYYDDSSLNETSDESTASMAETTEFNRNYDHTTGNIPKNISVRNLKRLLRYFVSLLHSIDENNDRVKEFLNEYKFGKVSSNTKSANRKPNRTNTTPVVHNGTNAEQITDTEFKNLDEGNNNEYNDEDISSKNSHKKASGIKISKSDIGENHTVPNHGDNPKLITELFQTGGANAKRSSLKSGQVSDEFIDEYINPPKDTVLMEYDDEYISNQSIISDESEEQAHEALKEDDSEENVYETEDRKLSNTQNPVPDNIAMKKDETSRNVSENTDSSTDIASSDQVGDLGEGNLNSVIRNSTQKYFSSNSSTIAVSDKPRSHKNYNLKITPSSGEDTLNEYSDTSAEIEMPRSKNSKITSIEEDTYDSSNQKNFSVLVDSRKHQFSTKNSSRELEMQSKQVSSNTEEIFNRSQFDESYSRDRLFPQNGSIDAESRNNTDIPIEQHSLTQVNFSKLEEKDIEEYLNKSVELKEQTDSDTGSGRRENSDSEESHVDDDDDDDEYYENIQEMSNFAINFTGILSNDTAYFTPNLSVIYTNYSREMELPTSPLDKNKNTTLLKTKELFNSILEFLYKYSNSTWIKKFREENRKT